VLATLHTIDAPKAIDRIVDAFPPDQQSQIIAQLANALQAIIAQRLLPKADGTGRVACTEVMVMNDGIRALLRDRRFQQVLSMIEIGSKDGMNTFDESVANLYAAGLITQDEALLNARDPGRIMSMRPPKLPPLPGRRFPTTAISHRRLAEKRQGLSVQSSSGPLRPSVRNFCKMHKKAASCQMAARRQF